MQFPFQYWDIIRQKSVSSPGMACSFERVSTPKPCGELSPFVSFSLFHNLAHIEPLFGCLKIWESFMGPRHKWSLTCFEKENKAKQTSKRERERGRMMRTRTRNMMRIRIKMRTRKRKRKREKEREREREEETKS